MLFKPGKRAGSNRVATLFLAVALIVTQLAGPTVAQQQDRQSVDQETFSHRHHHHHHHHHKHHKHPVLRKVAIAAAIGAATGGVGGLILGGSIATHAAAGAGIHAGVTAVRNSKTWKEHRDRRRRGQDHGSDKANRRIAASATTN